MPDSDSPTPTALQAAAGLIASGRAAEAARELNALVRAAPTYAAAYVLLAKAREASGDRVRALDAWHRAHFLVPSSPLVQRERQRLLDALAPPPAPGTLTLPQAPLPLAPEPSPEPELPYALHPPYAATAPPAPEPTPEPEAPAREPEPVAPTPDPEPTGPEASGGAPEVESATPEASDAMLLPPVVGNAPGTARATPEVSDPGGWEVVDEHTTLALPESQAPPVAPEVVSPSAPDATASGAPTPQVSDANELPSDGGLDIDLDALIRDLEDAPRIKPDPDFEGPDMVTDEDSVEEMASETLAQIYAAQQQYAEAAVVYEKLARQKPDRAAEMERRAAEMRERAQ